MQGRSSIRSRNCGSGTLAPLIRQNKSSRKRSLLEVAFERKIAGTNYSGIYLQLLSSTDTGKRTGLQELE